MTEPTLTIVVATIALAGVCNFCMTFIFLLVYHEPDNLRQYSNFPDLTRPQLLRRALVAPLFGFVYPLRWLVRQVPCYVRDLFKA